MHFFLTLCLEVVSYAIVQRSEVLSWIEVLEYNPTTVSKSTAQLCFMWLLRTSWVLLASWGLLLCSIVHFKQFHKSLMWKPKQSRISLLCDLCLLVKPYWSKDYVIASFHIFWSLTTSLPRKYQAKFFNMKWEIRSDGYNKLLGVGFDLVFLFCFILFLHENTPSNSPLCWFMLGFLNNHFYIL